MFVYSVGYPFWKTFARFGGTLFVSVDMFYDDEVEVFIATSSNLRGLVVEAPSFKELLHEIRTASEELLHEALSYKAKTQIKIRGLTLV